MSCYICKEETFLKVLQAWYETKVIHADQGQVDMAWRDIITANYEAYKDRYGDGYSYNLDEVLPEAPKVEDLFMMVGKYSKYELYRAVMEYMYQCAEGECHKRSGYYKSQWVLDRWLDEFMGEYKPKINIKVDSAEDLVSYNID